MPGKIISFIVYNLNSRQVLSSILKCSFFIFIACIVFNCKKPFNPVPLTARTNYLVVDGVINTGANGVTAINLSRARSLSDSTYNVLPESNAVIIIESSTGAAYQLHEATPPAYISDPLNLDISQTYRLHITTSNGEQYLSDLVAVKQSPPIDSITWQQDDGVHIYANTHDATNSTTYYRWDFTETWQHNARYETTYGVSNGLIFNRDSTNSIYKCWSNNNSTSVILGNSVALSRDVISKQPITTIPADNEKIAIRYSILVRQYALTPDAYKYWGIIQNNTLAIGTLFDVQPSQLHGNIASVSDKSEPVLGFISAGSVQEKRIFINYADLVNWTVPPSQQNCDIVKIPQNPLDFRIYNYPDTSFSPYYFITPGIIAITKNICLDCRYQGGSNVKPSFW